MWVGQTMVISNRLLLLGRMEISDWSLERTISYWMMGAAEISDWLLGTILMSDWLLAIMVISDWLLRLIVFSHWLLRAIGSEKLSSARLYTLVVSQVDLLSAHKTSSWDMSWRTLSSVNLLLASAPNVIWFVTRLLFEMKSIKFKV